MSATKTLIRRFGEKLGDYPEEQRNQILSAARWAAGLHQNQKRASGEPFIIHPLSVAEILVDHRLDYQSVMAGLLHDIIEDTEVTRKDLRREYGREVEALVQGVTKISVIRGMSKSVQQAETIRKMLFAMVKDIRVILIKLADKLHNMRTLEHLEEAKRKRIATECLEIYAPLAARLGMSRIRSELEDLSLKYLHPEAYEQIKQYVAAKKSDRSEFLEQFQESIRQEAVKAGVEVTIEARAKHFYSIYKKLKRKGKSLDEMYDLFGIRLLCENQGQCYELLGIVHKLWTPIEGRFKDYIAMPKTNRYQSLHTTVMGPLGRMVEFQIRTKVMQQLAENGIAAHWLYKSAAGAAGAVRPEELTIINKLKSWSGEKSASEDFLEGIKRELLKDSIYVFTPKGDVIDLPKGATALDFAYRIHTEVGHHCLAAKADGSVIPLREELRNTQVIEIVTSNNARPHLNWLRNVRTSRARSKIRHWLNQHDASLFIDRNIVAKQKTQPPPQPRKKPGKPEKPDKADKPGKPDKQILDKTKIGIKIGNEKNMMIRLARCCEPAVGDEIIGYVSRGRGIIVHRADCPNLKFIKEVEERSVEVEWETVSPKATKRFQVSARATSNLFSEIEGAIKKYHGHLIEGKLEDAALETLQGTFTVELDNGADFSRVLKSLRAIPAVTSIRTIGS
jgi:guanosine-3',5'-bis(diphosphate) 3'-pyrophosphohydrolase